MVDGIRQIEQAIGNGIKIPGSKEQSNIVIVRKSIIAACRIKKGEIFTRDNLAVKRPGNGVSPMKYWQMLGTRAERDYEEDEVI